MRQTSGTLIRYFGRLSLSDCIHSIRVAALLFHQVVPRNATHFTRMATIKTTWTLYSSDRMVIFRGIVTEQTYMSESLLLPWKVTF